MSDLDERLREDLVAGILERLGGEGWAVADRGDVPPSIVLAIFTRPLSAEFAAAAAVMVDGADPRVVVDVLVGIVYEPLRRLAPWLGWGRGPLVATSVDDVDVEPAVDAWTREKITRANASGVAVQIADLIARVAAPYAERHASLPALLDEYGPDEDGEYTVMFPALLAASGRFEEARQALDACAEADHEFERQHVRRLRRWIESGGDEALIAQGQEQERERARERPARSVGEMYGEAMRTQKALDVVRQTVAHLPREEQAARLAAELETRGVRKSPIWIDRSLDQLWDSPKEQRARALRAIKGAGRFGLAAIRALRTGEIPDPSPPAWLRPPDRVGEPAPTSGDTEWAPLALDADAVDYVRKAFEDSGAKLAGIVTLEGWVEPAGDNGVLGVHLGTRRIGAVTGATAARFDDVLRRAARVSEVPAVAAKVATTTQPPGFLVQIALPDREASRDGERG